MRRTPLLTLAAAAAIATTLVGCGGSDDAASGCTVDSTLEVHAKDELKFDKDAYSADAKCIEVEYVNDGSTAHDLQFEGVSDFKLTMGASDKGTVELDPGTYTMYCDIAGHRSAGMEAEVTVS